MLGQMSFFGYPEIVEIAVSDGGEGWLEAIHRSLGGRMVDVEAHDPLMRPIVVPVLIDGSKAYIESAKVIGLGLLADEERNPLVASSYGLGELVAGAVRHGASDIIVGLGGSGTSDAGIGMLKALENSMEKLTPSQRNEIPENICFTIATDVRSPLYGHNGAACLFARQKGADDEMVKHLERRDRLFARIVGRKMGYDCSNLPGAGAAGGLGYAFMQFLDARCVSGAECILDAIGFDNFLNDASIVITGEGRADRQTVLGKLPYVILKKAQQKSVSVYLIAGRIEDYELLLKAGFSKIIEVTPRSMPLELAMNPKTAKMLIEKLLLPLSRLPS